MIIFRVPQARKMYHMSFKITKKILNISNTPQGKNPDNLMDYQKNKLD